MTASQVTDAAADAAVAAYKDALDPIEKSNERAAMKEAIAAAVNAQPGIGGPPPTGPV